MSERAYAGGPQGRYLLLGATVSLVVLGLVMIWSASSAADFVRLGDSAYHVKRQAASAAAGLVLMLVLERIDFHRLQRYSWVLWGASAAGLLAVLVSGIGKWGSTRWAVVGGLTIQPSEYAKAAVVMVTASLLTAWCAGRLADKDLFGRLALAVVPVVVLIMAQPDLGTTIALVAAVYLVLLLGGLRKRYLAAMGALGASLCTLAVFTNAERAARFVAFLDPWADPRGDGYQTIQAFLAFGSGGPTGVGLGMSDQKFFYLPAAHTDFILAIIGEELGLFGSLGVVGAFGVFAYAGFRIAMGTRDRFGRLLAGGLTAMIVAQAVMNMAAVTALMPVTGIPLPLVSYGGSSLTFTLLCVGVVLSVARRGCAGRGRRVRPEGERSHDALPAQRGRYRRARLPGTDGGRAAAGRRA
ncbi:MAG: putative lipid II flippase FtsW [Coriobacteriia bacterium]|nr:putative lipid II flippase FtsW [Coriobacteriia bacterium]